MEIKKLHSWNLSYSQAIALQKQLSKKVRLIELKNQPKTIAGIDCALTKDGQRIVAAVVVLKPPGFELVEKASDIRKVTIPYIPGLLSFREAPACIAAAKKLKKTPDAFIIDGQGIAHPRRLGLAAHLGLFFNRPTIGCAKSRLTGNFKEPPLEKGTHSLLKDRKNTGRKTSHEPQVRPQTQKNAFGKPATNQEIIGAVVRTRTNVKPVFVSVGNKCTLKDAVKITLACATKYRLPEPTRLAHQLVGKLRLNA